MASKKSKNLSDLLDYRAKLVEISQNQIGLFDKSSLAISGGALGISFAYLDKLVADDGVKCLSILVISWGLLLSTILLNLFSYWMSWYENRNVVHKLDEALKTNNLDVFYTYPRKPSLTEKINIICIFTLGFGIGFLATFAVINLPGV